jgi:hypothetical protein
MNPYPAGLEIHPDLAGYSKIRVAVREVDAAKLRFPQENATSYTLLVPTSTLILL